MSKQQILIALLLPLIVGLAGCGGSDGDNVGITINESGGDDGGGGGGGGVGDCSAVVPAAFVTFNPDCSEGTLSGTITEDYTLHRAEQRVIFIDRARECADGAVQVKSDESSWDDSVTVADTAATTTPVVTATLIDGNAHVIAIAAAATGQADNEREQ